MEAKILELNKKVLKYEIMVEELQLKYNKSEEDKKRLRNSRKELEKRINMSENGTCLKKVR